MLGGVEKEARLRLELRGVVRDAGDGNGGAFAAQTQGFLVEDVGILGLPGVERGPDIVQPPVARIGFLRHRGPDHRQGQHKCQR